MICTIDYNENIGSMLPVSLFVEFERSDSIAESINEFYNSIISYGLQDVILYGDIASNIDSLNFLVSRLLIEGMYVSIVISDITYASKTIASSLICFVQSKDLISKKKLQILKSLRDSDNLILLVSSNKDLLYIRNFLINNKIKSKILAKGVIILEAKVYDVYPYTGEVLDSY